MIWRRPLNITMVRRSPGQTGLAEVQPLTAVLPHSDSTGRTRFMKRLLTWCVFVARGAISCLAVPPLVRPRFIASLGFLQVQVLLAKLS